MRKLLIPCLVLAAAAALAIVASATGARSASAAPTAIPGCGVDSLTLVADGTLTIGADNPAFPPWFGGAEKTKPWKVSDPYSGKGYESAVAYAVAKELGFTKAQVKWTVVPFANSFRPGKKSFDFYLTQVSYTPERDRAVDFSDVVLLRQPGGRRAQGRRRSRRRSRSPRSSATSSAPRSGRRATRTSRATSSRRSRSARLRHERRCGAGAEERPARRDRRRPARPPSSSRPCSWTTARSSESFRRRGRRSASGWCSRPGTRCAAASTGRIARLTGNGTLKKLQTTYLARAGAPDIR